jgi:AraC-like DNA-binding protein
MTDPPGPARRRAPPHAASRHVSSPPASLRRLVRARDFGEALEGWGHFAGEDGREGAPGEWIRAEGELIRGELDRTQLDLITVDARHLVVTRTPEHVERTPGLKHIVVVQVAGTSVLTPGDGHGPVRLGPGDVSYGHSNVPYRWEFAGPMTLMMLRAPFAAMDLAPAALQPLLGEPFSSDAGYPRLAVRFARQVLHDPELLQGANGPRIVQGIVGLFATMLAGQLVPAADTDSTEPAFRRVVEYISAHLAEPLDLPGIAAAQGMSTRYVQGLFQERGMTASGWLRQRRLEVARQALADPAWARATITQVATAHGFADHAHFSRTFRAAFGETPSRWRERAPGG